MKHFFVILMIASSFNAFSQSSQKDYGTLAPAATFTVANGLLAAESGKKAIINQKNLKLTQKGLSDDITKQIFVLHKSFGKEELSSSLSEIRKHINAGDDFELFLKNEGGTHIRHLRVKSKAQTELFIKELEKEMAQNKYPVIVKKAGNSGVKNLTKALKSNKKSLTLYGGLSVLGAAATYIGKSSIDNSNRVITKDPKGDQIRSQASIKQNKQ